MKIALFFIFLPYQVIGQITFDGVCPEFTVQTNFQLDSYLGTWYGNQKYPARFIGPDGRCNTAEYSLFENGTVKVVNWLIGDNGRRTTIGKAEVIAPAQLYVQFPNSRLPVTKLPNYNILETDYTTYTVVYSCRDITKDESKPQHDDIVWILTRERNPAIEIVTKALSVLERENLSRDFLQKTPQNDCPVDKER